MKVQAAKQDVDDLSLDTSHACEGVSACGVCRELQTLNEWWMVRNQLHWSRTTPFVGLCTSQHKRLASSPRVLVQCCGTMNVREFYLGRHRTGSINTCVDSSVLNSLFRITVKRYFSSRVLLRPAISAQRLLSQESIIESLRSHCSWTFYSHAFTIFSQIDLDELIVPQIEGLAPWNCDL